MKLLQWNVFYQEDIDNILRTIVEVGPDILCLQELTTNHPSQRGRDAARHLAEGLGMHCFYQPAQQNRLPDGGTHTYGNAILSRHPIVKSSFRYIQRPPRRPEARSNSALEPRIYLEAKLRIGDRTLDVATTHMSYVPRFRQTAAKRQEADKLVNILRRKKRNFIIGGDFNSAPNSYTVKAIERHLKNAGPPRGEKTWTTKPFSYLGFSANTLDWRIDYVFTTPDIQVTSALIVDTPYSDHLPVLIEIDF